MIEVKENMTNIYLGEGTIGIGITLDTETKRPVGISFCELEVKMEIGSTVEREGFSELNNVNIIFTDKSGISSLLQGVENFVESYKKWDENREGK